MDQEPEKKPMPRKFETITKTKVSPKIMIGVIIFVGLIGLSFVGASLLSTGVTLINNTNSDDAKGGSSCKAHQVAANDLLAYYPFDENAYDSSGMNYSGVAYDGVSANTDGIMGKAFEFDGADDYIALPIKYCPDLRINQITVCTWFNTNSIVNDNFGNWSFVDFDRNEYFNFFINEKTGQLGFSTHSEDNEQTHDLYSNEMYFYDEEWHFACAVYDGTDKFFYIQDYLNLDGIKDEGTSLDLAQDNYGINAHNGNPLYSDKTRYGFIGDGSEATTFNGSRNNKYYKGKIDELRIYERALSLAEMESLYEEGAGLKCATEYDGMGIDPKNLTEEQQNLLETFPPIDELENIDLSIIENYNWIDLNRLAICDKIFLQNEIEELMTIISILGSQ